MIFILFIKILFSIIVIDNIYYYIIIQLYSVFIKLLVFELRVLRLQFLRSRRKAAD
ncbi:hypothetical protein SAMN05660206_102214 [Sphingobacterium wenxiniae]|uniref:Uncharacterized protein n=1 Tax=Sphingobacterium wenxiniae TaxID=683125 RepID=A0A1I6Q9Y3_9SPHI|nr:hypothetical protein SAMN05660206_102214 [Sphingobacterium wenxiniae]